MTDRRSSATGKLLRLFQQVELRRERRGVERRDSPRAPVKLQVRSIFDSSGLLTEREGNISLGGAFWTTPERVVRSDVELRFSLPDDPDEHAVIAELVRVARRGEDIGVHVRFVVIDVLTELAVARYLESYARTYPEPQIPEALAVDWLEDGPAAIN